jgi:hypothetical protein
MTSDTIWQLIRYALLLVFGPLVTKGYITADQVTTVLGALGALFTIGWGVWVKFGTKATTAEAAAKPTVPVVSAATGTVQK